MTSRRARANHLNAQKSTGPRSIAGKQCSAKNAHRHGLSLPATSDPELCKEIERLAMIIAGVGGGSRRLEAARHIVEPHIARIWLRRARLLLLSDPRERIKQLKVCKKIEAATLLLEDPKDPHFVARAHDVIDHQSRAASPTIAAGLEILAPKLMRLDQYERRAPSRRKKAIRTFDLLPPFGRADKKKENSIRV